LYAYAHAASKLYAYAHAHAASSNAYAASPNAHTVAAANAHTASSNAHTVAAANSYANACAYAEAQSITISFAKAASDTEAYCHTYDSSEPDTSTRSIRAKYAF
jgi:hypothetical protein